MCKYFLLAVFQTYSNVSRLVHLFPRNIYRVKEPIYSTMSVRCLLNHDESAQCMAVTSQVTNRYGM